MLSGGLALASHHVIRATHDVARLVEAEKADAIDAKRAELGYSCIHRSTDAANYFDLFNRGAVLDEILRETA